MKKILTLSVVMSISSIIYAMEESHILMTLKDVYKRKHQETGETIYSADVLIGDSEETIIIKKKRTFCKQIKGPDLSAIDKRLTLLNCCLLISRAQEAFRTKNVICYHVSNDFDVLQK